MPLPPLKTEIPFVASRAAQEKRTEAAHPKGNLYRIVLHIEHDLRLAKKALIRHDQEEAQKKLKEIQDTINTLHE